MSAPADTQARVRALTDLRATLLVEAAAGTGKTSLIAGRMTMLLASGYGPSSLAAITFMEAAASELSARVHRYVHELLNDTIPTPLKVAFPNGLSPGQRESLTSARTKLDGLTTSTIHGFCQSIICSYAAESNVDPGARVIDAAEADVAFDAVFDRWLRKRLTVTLTSTDPIAVLSKEDPKHIVSIVRELARFRIQHRSARTVAEDLSGRPDIDLVEAVQAFRRWVANVPQEHGMLSVVADLEALAAYYKDAFKSLPDFPSLWRLAHPPRVASMRKDSFQLKPPQCKSAWQKIAGPSEGARLNDEGMALFSRADSSFRVLHGKIATALAARLSNEIDEVFADYTDFKRAAAVLDFDDLLYRARDLIVTHDEVRAALGHRYSQILVDEFQDTDPIQAEILFRIAAINSPIHWHESQLRDGSLFMVGDPKQAIFRFRGADIETYGRARRAIERAAPKNILHVNASFRSQSDILVHVNRCFEEPLSAEGQPGYVPLISTRESSAERLPSVAKRTVQMPEELGLGEPRAADVRDAEAREVAHVCALLVGNMEVREDNGRTRALLPADIALLTPTANELWRYEQALEERGLPFASQAGKNLLGRQEIQDLLSIARVLADPYDTLAFGALMRGPLVGLTENELLDITANVQAIEQQPSLSAPAPRFSVLTDPEVVGNPVAKETLSILRDLRRHAYSTTPALLLGEAIERLAIRPVLAMRAGERANQALANVDAFLDFTRGYNVRGLKQFVTDVTRDWKERVSRREGRVDAAGEAIEIVTMHSSKGLEWPVVLLINTFTRFRSRDQFVHRPSDDTLHWVLGDVAPPELDLALRADAQSVARERQRLFYVAFTRARDLLVLLKVPDAGEKSWTAIVEDPHRGLSELDLSAFAPQPIRLRVAEPNQQTAEIFSAQQTAISENLRRIQWLRPSQGDLDRVPSTELLAAGTDDEDVDIPLAIGAGQVRGLILHKLMEEVLNSEIVGELQALVERANELLAQFTTPTTKMEARPLAEEMGSTALKTLALPDIAPLRHGLVPELTVFGNLHEEGDMLLAGRADAVFVEDSQARLVLDWKSDVAPSIADVESHAAQLAAYMRATKINRGALVYMSTSRVHWISLAG